MKKSLAIFGAVLVFLALAGCIQSAEDDPAVVPPDCNSFGLDACPAGCVVCPPCEVCSSLRCATPAFCESMGFDANWMESISS